MGNIKGNFDFSANLNVVAAGPLDTRMLVPTIADLTAENNWNNNTHPVYNGMIVVIEDTGDIYVLKDKTKIREESGWKKIGENNFKWTVLK